MWHKVARRCSALCHHAPGCFQSFGQRSDRHRAVLLSWAKAEAAGAAHDGVHFMKQHQMCSGVGFQRAAGLLPVRTDRGQTEVCGQAGYLEELMQRWILLSLVFPPSFQFSLDFFISLFCALPPSLAQSPLGWDLIFALHSPSALPSQMSLPGTGSKTSAALSGSRQMWPVSCGRSSQPGAWTSTVTSNGHWSSC